MSNARTVSAIRDRVLLKAAEATRRNLERSQAAAKAAGGRFVPAALAKEAETLRGGRPAPDANGVSTGGTRKHYVSRYRVTYKPRGTGDDRILYAAQEKQDLLHSSTAPNICYGGAAGGGKSHGLRWHGIINCLRRPGLKVLLLRRMFKELENTHLLELQKECPREVARYHAQLKRLIFTHPREAGGDSILQFGHCQREKDIASYLSTQWDLILIDEASQFTPKMLSLLQSRLRTKLEGIRPQFVLATNPGGESHLWTVARFIDRQVDAEEDPTYKPEEYAFIQALAGDNRYNDETYILRLMSLPPAEREAYLYGNWHSFAGQYFREWSASVHCLDADPEFVVEWWQVAAGMDWGYDPSPGIVLWATFDPHGRPLLYKELKFSLCSPREVAEQIVARCDTEQERRMTIYGDSQMWERNPSNRGVSIADEINERLAELGTEITLVQANKDRLNGWMRVHQYLDPRRPSPEGGAGPYLRVLRGDDRTGLGCPYLIATLPAQRHSDKQDGDLHKQGNDHACDTLRYLLMAQPPLSILPRALEGGKPHDERLRQARVAALERSERLQKGNLETVDLEDDMDVEDTGLLPSIDGSDDDLLALAEGADDLWN